MTETTLNKRPLAQHYLCSECDLMHEIQDMKIGKTACCSRCGAILFHKHDSTFDRNLAFAVSGLVFFVIANLFPILTFSFSGNFQANQLIDGAIAFFQTDYWILGVLVFFVSVVAPFLVLSFLIGVLVPLHFGKPPKYVEWQIRSLIKIRPWAMAEILVIGIMVAYVKLGDFAIVHAGFSFLGIIAMVLATVFSFASLDFQALWQRVEEVQRK